MPDPVMKMARASGIRLQARWTTDWVRPMGLSILAVISAAGYFAIWPVSGDDPLHPMGAAVILVLLSVPYILATWWVVCGAPPRHRRWRQLEWGAILIGGGIPYLIVLPLKPLFSPDVYRYAWDARLTRHGFSPYLSGPASSAFGNLRDTVIYPNVPWLHSPTIYPPAAQGLFLGGGALTPGIWGIKLVMVLTVALTAVVLIWYLREHGQDTRRVLIWLWSPLVVAGFGIDGHVDAAAIGLWLAALLVAGTQWRWSRAFVGVLLALATLVKLYPVIFLLALGRRRDRALYIAFGGVLLLGYLPFLSGGTHVTGFLVTYLADPGVQGYLASLIGWLQLFLTPLGAPLRVVQALDAGAAIVAVVAIVAARRRSMLPSSTASIAALLLAWLAFTPHTFPWYATALLPLAAICLRAPWSSTGAALAFGLWSFASAFSLFYIAHARGPQWLYGVLYVAGITSAAAALLAHAAVRHTRRSSPLSDGIGQLTPLKETLR